VDQLLYQTSNGYETFAILHQYMAICYKSCEVYTRSIEQL